MLSGKESAFQFKRCKFDSWFKKIPWGRKWQPTPAFLPGEFHGQRRLVGYSSWGHKESDMTEQLTHFILKILPPSGITSGSCVRVAGAEW